MLQIPGNVECSPRTMIYSSKQHLFLVVFELSGANGSSIHEVVLYWEQTDPQSVNTRGTSVKGGVLSFIWFQFTNMLFVLDIFSIL